MCMCELGQAHVHVGILTCIHACRGCLCIPCADRSHPLGHPRTAPARAVPPHRQQPATAPATEGNANTNANANAYNGHRHVLTRGRTRCFCSRGASPGAPARAVCTGATGDITSDNAPRAS